MVRRLADPCWDTANERFSFLNYEGLRLSQADAQILTVPTPAELQGDFSMSSIKIYDPTTAVANPNYDPTKPTGPNNFPYTRGQFSNNQIPKDRINPNLEAFLMNKPGHAEPIREHPTVWDGHDGDDASPRDSGERASHVLGHEFHKRCQVCTVSTRLKPL